MTFIFDSGARLQGEIRSCSGATSFPAVRSKIFATTPAPNFVGEPINPKTIKKKKKDVWASFLSLIVFQLEAVFIAYSTEKKLKLTPNYAPITDNYLAIIFQSVFLTKKNTVYTNFVYLNYGN